MVAGARNAEAAAVRSGQTQQTTVTMSNVCIEHCDNDPMSIFSLYFPNNSTREVLFSSIYRSRLSGFDSKAQVLTWDGRPSVASCSLWSYGPSSLQPK